MQAQKYEFKYDKVRKLCHRLVKFSLFLVRQEASPPFARVLVGHIRSGRRGAGHPQGRLNIQGGGRIGFFAPAFEPQDFAPIVICPGGMPLILVDCVLPIDTYPSTCPSTSILGGWGCLIRPRYDSTLLLLRLSVMVPIKAGVDSMLFSCSKCASWLVQCVVSTCEYS